MKNLPIAAFILSFESIMIPVSHSSGFVHCPIRTIARSRAAAYAKAFSCVAKAKYWPSESAASHHSRLTVSVKMFLRSDSNSVVQILPAASMLSTIYKPSAMVLSASPFIYVFPFTVTDTTGAQVSTSPFFQVIVTFSSVKPFLTLLRISGFCVLSITTR